MFLSNSCFKHADTQALFDTMLLTAPSSGGGGGDNAVTPETIVDNACTVILNTLPKDIDTMVRVVVVEWCCWLSVVGCVLLVVCCWLSVGC